MNWKTPVLPALKSLGDLATAKPLLIIDSREQSPLVFTRFESIRGTLQTGDYSIAGLEELFAVERKSIDDLVGCCIGDNRERFERELHRLRGFRFKRLLVVGSRGEIQLQRYRSRILPKSVLGSLNAWECRYDVPIVFSQTPAAAALEIERWSFFFAREVVKGANALARATT
jgi:DNA excision repair protein ERCC-4